MLLGFGSSGDPEPVGLRVYCDSRVTGVYVGSCEGMVNLSLGDGAWHHVAMVFDGVLRL
jgi:hypothetical protein